MEAVAQSVQPVGDELRIFPDWRKKQEDVSRATKAGIASLLLHGLGIIVLFFVPLGGAPNRHATRIIAELKNPTPLIAPPAELTQKAPNRAAPSKEFDLEGLLPRPRLEATASPPSTTRPAARVLAPPLPVVLPVPALPEPPKVEAAQGELSQPPLLARGTTPIPPPQIQAEEKPKLAFETPGVPAGAADSGSRTAGGLKPPSSHVSEVMRDLARRGGGGGLVVGDIGEGVGGLGEGLNLPPSPGNLGSNLELLSDPAGVDFRPYLIRILSAVRRNWFAVMPESAKLGRRGRVAIQFAVNRDGSIPKLVIASPSGTQALDRAAVAGISASNPLPPLPAEYRGLSVRLQFVFLYNMKSN